MIKGSHHTKENIRKMKLVRLGKHYSPQTEFKKGQIPWNKDKPRSEETKEKISKANKGKQRSKEFKLMISKRLTGTHHSEETKKKISESHKGILASRETKIKISEIRKELGLSRGNNNPMYGKLGENASNWRGGISFEKYPQEFNKQLKELIRQRDNYKCQLCGMPEIENIKKLTVHHIDYVKNNCLPDNLISLCNCCHLKTNANRDYWEESFKEKILEKVK